MTFHEFIYSCQIHSTKKVCFQLKTKKALVLSENASCDFVFVSQLLGVERKISRQEDSN